MRPAPSTGKDYFGVHTWIAVKRSGAPEFTVHEVIGYRLRRDGTTVVSRVRAARQPLVRRRARLAQRCSRPRRRCTDRSHRNSRYRTIHTTAPIASGPAPTRTPSPPSSFAMFRSCASTCRRLRSARIISASSRWRSLRAAPAVNSTFFGLAGVAAGWEEGVELNLLGLTFGVDPVSLSIKLPLLGRIGPDDHEPVIIE